ncbi:MAG: ribonuclease P protein component [Chloroflexi bacterium]|nr:ribonuclease P protein component [Chloroflexota bacterium]
MQRRFRLRGSEDFQRVRQQGRSWSHTLLVLSMKDANGLPYSRFGIVTNKRTGSAVVRNRVKRLIRHALRRRLDTIVPGYDLVIIARGPVAKASWDQVDSAVEQLLKRAGLLKTATIPALF